MLIRSEKKKKISGLRKRLLMYSLEVYGEPRNNGEEHVLRQLRHAALKGQSLTFQYRAKNKDYPTVRHTKPVAIHFAGNQVVQSYLSAFDLVKDVPRTFLLAGIQHMSLSVVLPSTVEDEAISTAQEELEKFGIYPDLYEASALRYPDTAIVRVLLNVR